MKKMLALVLCVFMIVGLFAGCNNDKPTPTNPPATQGGNKPAGTTAPATTADDGRSPVGELPIVTDGSKPVITIGLQQLALTEDYETNDYTLWIEEQTGVDLQFVYFSSDSKESTQQINAMIAAGEKLPDILWDVKSSSDNTSFNEWGRDGYVIDLMPYIEEYGHWIKWAQEEVRKLSPADADNIYAYGTDPVTGSYFALCNYTTQGIDACNCAMINQSFLDALGMDMPETIEELYDYLVAVRDKDPNGNGQKDEIPLVWRQGQYRADTMEFLLNAFVFINDTYRFNATNGELWMPYTTDEYREGLKWLNKMYAEGLIMPASWTMTEDSEMKAITSRADGVSIAGFIGGHPTLVLDPAVSEAIFDYVGFGPLKGATDKGGYSFKDSNGFVYTSGITADCEDPVLAFRVLDFMNCQESVIRQRYGVPGVHWEYATEGINTTYNIPAAVKILDSSAYTTQNNACWHVCEGVTRPSSMWCTASIVRTAEECETAAQWRSTMISGVIPSLFNAGPFPDEVVYTLVYNAEEAEVVSEYKKLVEDYIDEARALFISGAMDPNSDADWQKYLDSLENEGLSKWMEAAQSAYDRMNGK